MGQHSTQGVVFATPEIATRAIRILQLAHFPNPLNQPAAFKAARKAYVLTGTMPTGSTISDEEFQRAILMALLGLTIEGEPLAVDPRV